MKERSNLLEENLDDMKEKNHSLNLQLAMVEEKFVQA